MEKITYAELRKIFCDHEADRPDTHLSACIVFAEDSWTTKYPLESRTYEISSDNKAFIPGMGGYSIFGSSLDGTDLCVRLDRYMAVEHGGKDGWKVEYCYLIE